MYRFRTINGARQKAKATEDVDFLLDAGAEILVETGRFWCSRAQPEGDGYCHIRGVIGPDEYHEHIDDNAYTNVMARWNIRRALEVAAVLRQTLARPLGTPVRRPWLRRYGARALADCGGDNGDRLEFSNGVIRAIRRFLRA
jgi:hypothetical protein